MKPKTDVAMQAIIQQMKEHIPFSISTDELCKETCSYGCSKTLMEYLYQEMTDWEQRLARGEIPTLGDIKKLSDSSRKIYKVLEKNKVVPIKP